MTQLHSSTSTGAVAVVTAMFLATAGAANESIEDVLNGPFTTCTGAIAWTETDNDMTRVEPMRLAVPDADNATAIALFLAEDDVSSDNVWTCSDGVCTAYSTVRGAVTTNVLRFRHQIDLTGGEVVYAMDAVFLVVNARDTPIQVEGVQGTGSFICEKMLPDGLLSLEE